jgi:hypothetical protein
MGSWIYPLTLSFFLYLLLVMGKLYLSHITSVQLVMYCIRNFMNYCRKSSQRNMTRRNEFRIRSTRVDVRRVLRRRNKAVQLQNEQNHNNLRSAASSCLALNVAVVVRTCASRSTVEARKLYWPVEVNNFVHFYFQISVLCPSALFCYKKNQRCHSNVHNNSLLPQRIHVTG